MRVIKHAIPKAQRLTPLGVTTPGGDAGPSTSAAGRLQASVAQTRAEQEVDDGDLLTRRSTRFRFISDKTEKMRPNDDADGAADDKSDSEGEVGDGEGQQPTHTHFEEQMDVDEAAVTAGDAEEFLRQVEDQLLESVPLQPTPAKPSGPSKRRRAEDLS